MKVPLHKIFKLHLHIAKVTRHIYDVGSNISFTMSDSKHDIAQYEQTFKDYLH